MPREQDEDEAAQLNRNFEDLLQELRVSQNGTQILFAFLLTVPFSSGFSKVTSFERGLYFVTLMFAALSAAMLIAPAVMHRVLFHQKLKAQLVTVASWTAIGGQALLIFAVSGSVLLVGNFLYGLTTGLVLAAVTMVWWLGWFFLLPLRLRLAHRRDAANTSSR